MQVLVTLFSIIFKLFFIYFQLPLPLNIHFYSNLVSMTNKKGAGGAREGAGRPPKILEIKLIEQMDAIAVPNEIWKALLYKCQEGDTQALKLWLSYRFGLPKQQIDITSNGENIAPPIQWISKQMNFNQAEEIDFDPQDTPNEKKLALDTLSVKNSDYLSDQLDMWLK